MKYIFILLFIFVSFFESAAQIHRNRQYDDQQCHQITDTFRVRIVTLGTPDLWEPIDIPYVVERENGYYVFYSKEHGTYCRMLQLQSEVKEYMTKIVRYRL